MEYHYLIGDRRKLFYTLLASSLDTWLTQRIISKMQSAYSKSTQVQSLLLKIHS
jgi:hypothetical protein